MNINYEQLIKQSKQRITIEDMKLLERCCDLIKAKTILEIGSADGGSSVILGTKAKENGGHLYCIEPRPTAAQKGNMNQYGLSDIYTMIPKKSPWISENDIPEIIDLLFIDGCHEIRWAVVDYHYFEPFVREGGIIIFHDTSGNCREDKDSPDYGKENYTGKIQRAINLILETDAELLVEIDRSTAKNGGAIAYRKIERSLL